MDRTGWIVFFLLAYPTLALTCLYQYAKYRSGQALFGENVAMLCAAGFFGFTGLTLVVVVSAIFG